NVQGTLLLQSSGNSAFDTHVVRSAPLAIERLGEPPANGAGIHPEGIRSAWSFEGHVVYQKKLRDIDLKKDWWYHAITAPLALVTGTFDETTGDIYTTDFRNPKFVCKVKLLRVYRPRACKLAGAEVDAAHELRWQRVWDCAFRVRAPLGAGSGDRVSQSWLIRRLSDSGVGSAGPDTRAD